MFVCSQSFNLSSECAFDLLFSLFSFFKLHFYVLAEFNHEEVLLFQSREDFHKLIWISESERHGLFLIFGVFNDLSQFLLDVQVSIQVIDVLSWTCRISSFVLRNLIHPFILLSDLCFPLLFSLVLLFLNLLDFSELFFFLW